MSSFSNWELSV